MPVAEFGEEAERDETGAKRGEEKDYEGDGKKKMPQKEAALGAASRELCAARSTAVTENTVGSRLTAQLSSSSPSCDADRSLGLLSRTCRRFNRNISWPLVLSLMTFCITSWYYINIVKLTRHLQQANTLSLFHSEYSSQQILEAFESMEELADEVEYSAIEVAAKFWQLKKNKDPRGKQLDRARRRLLHWFSRLQYFYEFGFLTKDYLLRFPGADRAKHFIDLVEPLEVVCRLSTNRHPAGVFNFLREIYQLGSSASIAMEHSSGEAMVVALSETSGGSDASSPHISSPNRRAAGCRDRVQSDQCDVWSESAFGQKCDDAAQRQELKPSQTSPAVELKQEREKKLEEAGEL